MISIMEHIVRRPLADNETTNYFQSTAFKFEHKTLQQHFLLLIGLHLLIIMISKNKRKHNEDFKS